jgi:putative Ig domain-containing protein
LLFPRVSPSTSRDHFESDLQQIALAAVSLVVLLAAVGCGSGGSSQVAQVAQSTSQIHISVSPATITLSPGAQQPFTAAISGSSNSAVAWSASAGSITSTGVFTAPKVTNGTQITITATSAASTTERASGVATVQGQSTQLEITSTTLSPAVAQLAYEQSLTVSGGTPPYSWTMTQGSLPSGIALQGTTGVVSGTASQSGQYSFTAKVTDATSKSATQAFALSVSAQTSSNYDGPAALPRVYLNTTLADTPATGAIISVPAGGDLQVALNNASCGDTIELQAGAIFAAGFGLYTFPAKSCDDQHWIIVRTSASDTSLPAEGTRLTPCYAGVSSLLGRPALNCTSTQKVVATLSYSGNGDGPVVFADGANHYRLLGLEVTRAANNGKSVDDLIGPVQNESMSQIVLDRLYIHGTPSDETRRGVDLTGATSMAVQDSYISEIHCNSGPTGTCTDSQAVSGGRGSLPMGPWKIDDNFLEASGENILFGGGRATQTPADIEIRFNHLFKPMFWMPGQPGFTAPAFVVKNHFELKNAQRVLFDSNLLEDAWGGFTQHGHSVLLTPKNQGVDGESGCPTCEVTDVTIRYVKISHVAGGFCIGNGRDSGGGVALAGERYSIHDVIVDDIQRDFYSGYGVFAQVSTQPQPLLQEVDINHVTAFPTYVVFNVGAPEPVQIPGFTFANSIITTGTSPMNSTGLDGVSDCAKDNGPLKILNSCFTGYTFSENAFLASPLGSSQYPAGNFFYSISQIGFVNYNNGNGGNYNLLPSSPAIGAASDGTNLGANVGAVISAINGIE